MKKYNLSPCKIVTATFLPHLTSTVAQSFVGPLAPFLQQSLNISRAQIGSLTSLYSIGMIAVSMVAGSIIERTSLRLWIALPPVLSGLVLLLTARMVSLWQGLVLFLLLGIIYSFVGPATTKAIIIGFPRERRGTALGIKQTGVPAGVLLVSATLPVLALAVGWRECLVYTAFFNIAAGMFVLILYQEQHDPAAARPSLPDLGISFKKDCLELLRNFDFLLTSILRGIFNVGQYIIRTYLALFLVESAGYSVVHAGLVLSVAHFGGVVSRILWGAISDFVFDGRRVPVLKIIGYTTVAGLAALAMVGGSTPVWIVWAGASLAGAGTIGFGGVAILLRAELAGKNLAAAATGIGGSIAQIGVVAATPLFGLFVDATNSYRLAWLLVAAITLAATLLLRYISENDS